MDTAPQQLRQDLRLLDLFESLPAPSEPDSAALRQRLTDLCASQALEASPERVDRAVQRFLNQRGEPQPFERWKRPADHDEWTALIEILKAGQEGEKITKRDKLAWLLPSFLLGFLPSSVAFFMAKSGEIHHWYGVIVLCLGSMFMGFCGGAAAFLFAILGLEEYKSRSVTVKKANACLEEWNPDKRGFLPSFRDVWFFRPHKPDSQEMAQWLAVPECIEALQHIARSGVPLLKLDARHLSGLANSHDARRRQEQDARVAQEWEACTGLLADHNMA